MSGAILDPFDMTEPAPAFDFHWEQVPVDEPEAQPKRQREHNQLLSEIVGVIAAEEARKQQVKPVTDRTHLAFACGIVFACVGAVAYALKGKQ